MTLYPWSYCHAACSVTTAKQREPQIGLKNKERIITSVNNKCSHIDPPLCAAYQFSESSDKQYTGGSIFVDLASKFVHACHQCGTTVAETVLSKHNFCLQHGVIVKEYLADNQLYCSDDWKSDYANQRQSTIYSGVGAKH